MGEKLQVLLREAVLGSVFYLPRGKQSYRD